MKRLGEILRSGETPREQARRVMEDNGGRAVMFKLGAGIEKRR